MAPEDDDPDEPDPPDAEPPDAEPPEDELLPDEPPDDPDDEPSKEAPEEEPGEGDPPDDDDPASSRTVASGLLSDAEGADPLPQAATTKRKNIGDRFIASLRVTLKGYQGTHCISRRAGRALRNKRRRNAADVARENLSC